jgi:hypothetical protein
MVETGGGLREGTLQRSRSKLPQSTNRSCLMVHLPVTIPIAFMHGMLSGVRGP